MSTPQHPTPAGWYPDPAAPGTLRYWDGGAWTPHRQAASARALPPQGPRRSPGVDTNTVWIWLIVLMPLAPLLTLLFVPWAQVFDYSDVIHDPTLSTEASLRIFTTPMYWVALGLGWVAYGLAAWFAFLDRRELLARGIDQPFPWPWQFLNSVYAIGRSVVVLRRTGRGAGPLWALGAVLLLSLIVAGVITGTAMEAVLTAIREGVPYGTHLRG